LFGTNHLIGLAKPRARQAVRNAFGSVMGDTFVLSKIFYSQIFSRGIFILERPITSRTFLLMDPNGKMLNWLV